MTDKDVFTDYVTAHMTAVRRTVDTGYTHIGKRRDDGRWVVLPQRRKKRSSLFSRLMFWKRR